MSDFISCSYAYYKRDKEDKVEYFDSKKNFILNKAHIINFEKYHDYAGVFRVITTVDNNSGYPLYVYSKDIETLYNTCSNTEIGTSND